MEVCGLDFYDSGQRPAAGSCKHYYVNVSVDQKNVILLINN